MATPILPNSGGSGPNFFQPIAVFVPTAQPCPAVPASSVIQDFVNYSGFAPVGAKFLRVEVFQLDPLNNPVPLPLPIVDKEFIPASSGWVQRFTWTNGGSVNVLAGDYNYHVRLYFY